MVLKEAGDKRKVDVPKGAAAGLFDSSFVYPLARPPPFSPPLPLPSLCTTHAAQLCGSAMVVDERISPHFAAPPGAVPRGGRGNSRLGDQVAQLYRYR